MSTLVGRAAATICSLALLAAGTTAIAPTASAEPGLPYLREGSTGIGVKCVQSAANIALTSSGRAPIAVDGVFGPATKAAVELFQRNVDLPQDGIVGPLTGNDIVHADEVDDTMPGVICWDYVPTSS